MDEQQLLQNVKEIPYDYKEEKHELNKIVTKVIQRKPLKFAIIFIIRII